ncbi:MAG TPA: hypothetical protein VM869_28435, partial [Enhygromyxa sp.]|nr:hypothetical protein [Enhygromyxa sp.]
IPTNPFSAAPRLGGGSGPISPLGAQPSSDLKLDVELDPTNAHRKIGGGGAFNVSPFLPKGNTFGFWGSGQTTNPTPEMIEDGAVNRTNWSVGAAGSIDSRHIAFSHGVAETDAAKIQQTQLGLGYINDKTTLRKLALVSELNQVHLNRGVEGDSHAAALGPGSFRGFRLTPSLELSIPIQHGPARGRGHVGFSGFGDINYNDRDGAYLGGAGGGLNAKIGVGDGGSIRFDVGYATHLLEQLDRHSPRFHQARLRFEYDRGQFAQGMVRSIFLGLQAGGAAGDPASMPAIYGKLLADRYIADNLELFMTAGLTFNTRSFLRWGTGHLKSGRNKRKKSEKKN